MEKIASVFVLPDGMVWVCNENGEQMPKYQGIWSEKMATIMAATDGSEKWRGYDREKYRDE